MQRLRVVETEDDVRELEEKDLAEINESAKELIELLNNPITLMNRAIALLQGTAKPLELDHLLRG